jgi:hypothetical protein
MGEGMLSVVLEAIRLGPAVEVAVESGQQGNVGEGHWPASAMALPVGLPAAVENRLARTGGLDVKGEAGYFRHDHLLREFGC